MELALSIAIGIALAPVLIALGKVAILLIVDWLHIVV